MKLTDLSPLERWVEFEKQIFEKSGLSANVFDAGGVRISDFCKWPNELCPAVKATDKGQAFICSVAQMNLANRAQKKGRTVVDECDAGIMKMVVPIIVQNQFIGSVGACGLLLDNGEVDYFLVAKITEIEEDEVLHLAEGMSSISSENAFEIGREIENRIANVVNDYCKSGNVCCDKAFAC